MSLFTDITKNPDAPKEAHADIAPPKLNLPKVSEHFSMIREFNVQAALKTSDGSDAGKTDVVDRADAAGDVGFNLMRNTINSSGSVTGSDVADYIERAEDLNDEVDTVPFGLETDDGKIVKVYVNAEQADKFEEAMKNMLGLEDDIEEAINRLTSDFDIVDVVWPKSDDEDGDGVPDPDADLEIDDTTNLEDPEDDLDFSSDQYDVIAGGDGDTPEADASGKVKDKGEDAPAVDEPVEDEPTEQDDNDDDSPPPAGDGDDEDEDDEDDEEGDEEDGDEPDPDNPKKKKKRKKDKAAAAEPAQATESAIPSGPVLNEHNTQEKVMTIGKQFLERVLNEADGEDRDGVKDGFNIPLDSQARAMAAKQKLPWAKRLVAFHFMCGVPGRYMNSPEVSETIASAADMLRKKVAVRRAFSTLYEALGAAKGYTLQTDDAAAPVKESKIDEAKAKRGSFIQKLLESVLVELGLPETLVVTSGPAAVGTGIYRTAELIEQDSTMERALRLLATRMGIKGQDAMEPVEESMNEEKDAQFNSRADWLKAAKAHGKITVRSVNKGGVDIDQAIVGDAEVRGKSASLGEWDKKTGKGFVFASAAKRASQFKVTESDDRFNMLSAMSGKKPVDEAVDVGNDQFAQAVTALVSALGIPDDVLNRRRTQIVQALREKKATLGNRAQILTLMTRLQDLIAKSTNSSAAPADADEE